ncbi:MAG: hypothetical protein HYV47_01325 [Candidatus Nealsonbacteria bacterium]|nr:hypothetical protein [Candidatus Nealsonbacteria bacterium]
MITRRSVILFFAILIVLTAGLIACVQENENSSVFFKGSINLKAGITVGNRTFLPMHVRTYEWSDYYETVFLVLDAFEKAHPELEIISWNAKLEPHDRGESYYIEGISIESRLRGDKENAKIKASGEENPRWR